MNGCTLFSKLTTEKLPSPSCLVSSKSFSTRLLNSAIGSSSSEAASRCWLEALGGTEASCPLDFELAVVVEVVVVFKDVFDGALFMFVYMIYLLY